MDRFKENIDSQIEFNQGKNLFGENLDIFQFANETIKAISNIDKLNPDAKEYLIDYASDKAIEEFCRVKSILFVRPESQKQLAKDLRRLVRKLPDKNNPG